MTPVPMTMTTIRTSGQGQDRLSARDRRGFSPTPDEWASGKRRVASSVGHLNNEQAARLLETVGHPDLQWVVALHISEQNNSPDDVRNSLAGRLTGDGQTLYLAAQNTPSEWLEIT